MKKALNTLFLDRQGAKALTGPAGPLQAPQECGGHAEKSPFPRQALGKENVRVHPDLGEKITQANFTDGQGRKANRSTPVIDVRGIEMGLPPCPSRKRPSYGLGVRLRWAFPLCLTRERPDHGLGVRLRWAFLPACRGKGPLMD